MSLTLLGHGSPDLVIQYVQWASVALIGGSAVVGAASQLSQGSDAK